MKHYCTFIFILILFSAVSCTEPFVPEIEEEPEFDLSGDIIVYISSADWSLYLMNIETGQTKMLTDKAFSGARWSPDGEWIAYSEPVIGDDVLSGIISMIKADGSEKRIVTLSKNNDKIGPHPDGGFMGDWSSDGTRIAFSRGNGFSGGEINIFIIDVDTSGGIIENNVTNEGNFNFISDWSPDGGKIVFQSDVLPDGSIEQNTSFDWYTIKPDGTEKQRIILDDGAFSYLDLIYSPDGNQIAFIGGLQPVEIFIMDVDGSNIRQFTENDLVESYVSWSPDGTKLIFTAQPNLGKTFPSNLNNDIYLINIDGTGFVQLTSDGDISDSIDWRPVK